MVVANILAYCHSTTMEQHIFGIFIDYRGRHRKGVAIYDAIKSLYDKNLAFVEQKCILNTTERF